ncbi:hypothetical protein [Sanguibacter suaedae]|uniref:Uncharacterized protein n=1 Tax=Sanguibacter suaedae TaxID=2795737 RepID=A0A934ID51_9MICO|nr:hypothetical protein [Sanguibacter suaedae]MBI9116167.1 hypothetical protein [Sanguibacter suaedae]
MNPRDADRPATTTTLTTGPTVPGWVMHLTATVTALAAVLVTTSTTRLDTTTVTLVLAGLLGFAVVGLRRPGWTFTVVAASTVAATSLLLPDTYTWRTPVLVLAVHLLVRTGWFTTNVAPTARIETAVLSTVARPFVATNLVGQALALLAGALTTAAPHPVAALVGGGALVVLAALLLLPGRRHRDRSPLA